MSGGDTASDNEIMAPAAMVTPLDASSCIACIAETVCAIRGTGMTFAGTDPVSGTMVPSYIGASQWEQSGHRSRSAYDPKRILKRHRFLRPKLVAFLSA